MDLRQRLGRPLAGLMVILFAVVFIAATYHKDPEPGTSGPQYITFYSFQVPDRPEVDPETAGLPTLVVAADYHCPLCLWQCASKTVPGDFGVRVSAIVLAPERPAVRLCPSLEPVALTSLSCRAPPLFSV